VIGIAVVGYGYWGPNIARNIRELPGCRLAAVSDLRAAKLAEVRDRYPGVQATPHFHEVLANPHVDAVVIATPVSTHFELAMQALRAGKHVLVEKPMAMSSREGERLIEEADARGLVLAVDHTFVYTGAVRKIREIIDGQGLGDLYYYDSVRVNLGLFQRDVNVLWDLAVHDLSILDHLLPMKPCAVSATGIGHVTGEPENIAYMTLLFDAPLIAHIHVNWLAPVKVRRTLIGGSRKMIVYDDLEPSEKVKVYDKGITVNGQEHGNGNGNGDGDQIREMLVGYRAGDMWAPRLDMAEALTVELRGFVDCIEVGKPMLADGAAGLRVIRILEAASESIKQRGHVVELAAERVIA
jgi:predicted dehydrogenase